MQKINVLSILRGHYRTLRDSNGRFLWSDVGVFIGGPMLVAAVLYFFGWKLSRDALGQSIAVFAIFAALLLSVQVALYSVSLRPIEKPTDGKRISVFEERLRTRGLLIQELNDNISYLILISVIYITSLLVSYVMEWVGKLPSAVITAMYIHFFLTILMVIKRASIVFSREYEST